jgi:hypothetical protein
MRNTNNISLVEYIRHIIRSYREERLYKNVQESLGQFKKGKGRVLTSLKDLN